MLTFDLVLSNCLLSLFVLLLFSFLSKFSLSLLFSLLGPLGFWLLALPVEACSLECNDTNNIDNDISRSVTFDLELDLCFSTLTCP